MEEMWEAKGDAYGDDGADASSFMLKLGFRTAEKYIRRVNVLLYHSGVLHLNRFVV